MRTLFAAALLSHLVGCASPQTSEPREYLDERTAATITVVKDPWIFTRVENDTPASEQRDFLHLYAIDVNRMGEHRQYLAVLQSAPPRYEQAALATPKLELISANRTMTLEATAAEPREIGLAQPVAESYTMTAAWFYFPVDKRVLARIANTRDLGAAMILDDERVPYVLWRDGRDELSELTAVLP